MNYSCAFIRIVLSFLLTGTSVSLFGQVPGAVSFHRDRSDNLTDVRITWSAGDMADWHAAHGDRLDIPGLKISISASDIRVTGQTTNIFQLVPDQPVRLEAQIRIARWTPGERLALIELETGRELFAISDDRRPRVLTPLFSPEKTGWVWQGADGRPAVGDFIIEHLYLHPEGIRGGGDAGFNAALGCHPNAACASDSLSQSLAQSTVRIRMVMDEGIGWCTGALVNNTLQDRKPYLLTAFHCQYDFTPQYDLWRFDFGYAADSCATPGQEPGFTSLTGCELLALGQSTDFLLVLLDESVPENLPVTFAGWNRSDSDVPDTSLLVHHPRADIRKISTADHNTTIHPNVIHWTEGYSTPAHHHFRVRFTTGGHEAGSSGGPLFDGQGRLIGQLHGGTVGCEGESNSYVGRLSKSWTLGAMPSARLEPWLDAAGTNAMHLDGLANVPTQDIVNLTGQVIDPMGRPVRHAVVRISGDVTKSVMTDAEGRFQFSQLGRQGIYQLTPEKNDQPSNGLNALDLVNIQKHLLARDTFDFAWQHIAADATNNGSLAVGDILLILRLLLGKITAFPSSPSWRFDPAVKEIGQWPDGEPEEVLFTAIKIGDVNASADPQQ